MSSLKSSGFGVTMRAERTIYSMSQGKHWSGGLFCSVSSSTWHLWSDHIKSIGIPGVGAWDIPWDIWTPLILHVWMLVQVGQPLILFIEGCSHQPHHVQMVCDLDNVAPDGINGFKYKQGLKMIDRNGHSKFVWMRFEKQHEPDYEGGTRNPEDCPPPLVPGMQPCPWSAPGGSPICTCIWFIYDETMTNVMYDLTCP